MTDSTRVIDRGVSRIKLYGETLAVIVAAIGILWAGVVYVLSNATEPLSKALAGEREARVRADSIQFAAVSRLSRDRLDILDVLSQTDPRERELKIVEVRARWAGREER